MGGTRIDSHGAHRCNFNQFLEFIWAPKNPGEARPTVNILSNGEVFEQLTIGAVAERVYNYRDPVGDLKLTDNVDSDRLVTGLTGTNGRKWYEAVPKVGNAVGEAWLAPANIPLSPEDNRILNRGRAASDLTVDMRFQEIEQYREPFVRQRLGAGIEIQMKPGRRTDPNFVQSAWQQIDQQATIKRYQNTIPDIKQRLTDAMKAWREGSNNAKEHWAAFIAVEQARQGCRCGAL